MKWMVQTCDSGSVELVVSMTTQEKKSRIDNFYFTPPLKVALRPDSSKKLHIDTLPRMNTVIYVNYKKYFAQNEPALDFFIRMFKDGGCC